LDAPSLMGQPRQAHFCPQCGSPLTEQERYGRLRPVCSACNHTVFFDPKVAVAVLIEQDGRVLLIERGNDPLKGYWALPAGFVEWDEDPAQAAIRECREETGLHIQIDALLQLFHTPADGGLADLVIVYHASIVGGELCAGDDAESVAWFTPDTLPTIAFRPSQLTLQRWAIQQNSQTTSR
jgi:8-oxo-dGTP diphosphatase